MDNYLQDGDLLRFKVDAFDQPPVKNNLFKLLEDGEPIEDGQYSIIYAIDWGFVGASYRKVYDGWVLNLRNGTETVITPALILRQVKINTERVSDIRDFIKMVRKDSPTVELSAMREDELVAYINRYDVTEKEVVKAFEILKEKWPRKYKIEVYDL